MKQSETRAQLVETAERRAFVTDMRKSGATYRQIADATIKRFGVERLPAGYDERYAWQDVKRELDRLNRERTENTRQIRELELLRLDRLLFSLWSLAIGGEFGAIDRVLKIMKRRADLLGIDAPQKYQEVPFDASEYPDLDADEIIAEAERILGQLGS